MVGAPNKFLLFKACLKSTRGDTLPAATSPSAACRSQVHKMVVRRGDQTRRTSASGGGVRWPSLLSLPGGLPAPPRTPLDPELNGPRDTRTLSPSHRPPGGRGGRGEGGRGQVKFEPELKI